jgi:hypothetical protein
MSYENMSPADYAAVTRNNDGGMFGGESGAWWIIILLLFGWGGRGFGFGGQGYGGGGCGVPATQADLAAGFNNSAVLSGINGIDSALCQGFNGVNTAILQGVNSLERQFADCCCATQRAIDGVNYNLATQSCETRNTIQNTTRDIIDNANANSRAILDFLTQDKIATLTAENQSLKFAASQSAQNAFITANQEAQTAELIRRLGRDCPVPAYVVPNPNCCYQYNVQPACGCGAF